MLRVELARALRGSAVPEALCQWLAAERFAVRFEGGSGDASKRGSKRHVSAGYRLRIEPAAEGVRLSFERRAPNPIRRLRLLTPLDWRSATSAEVIAQAAHSLVGLPLPVGAAEPMLPLATPPAAASSPARAAEPDAALEAPTGGPASEGAHRLVAGYRGHYRGEEPWSHGPDLALELGWRPHRLRYFARVGVHAWRTGTGEVASLSLRLRGTDFNGGLGLGVPFGGWSLHGLLHYSLQRPSVRVSGVDETLRLLPLSNEPLRHFGGVEAGVSTALGPLRLALVSSLRWQLRSSPYRILEPQGLVVVAAPARAQPGLALRLEYPLP